MPKTPTHPVRIDPDEWREFGDLAALLGTDRSEVIRQLIRGWVRRQRRQLDRDPQLRDQARAITRS